MADLCSTIASQISSMLDREMQQGLEHQPTQRPTEMHNDTKWWRTVDGMFARDVGPAVPPLATAERLSLLGNVSHLGPSGSDLATKIERFQNVKDFYSRADYTFLQRSGVSKLNKEESVNLIQHLEGRTHELDEFGIHVYAPGTKPVEPMNQRVASVANSIRAYFADRDQLASREIDGYKSFGSNYFPIMHETDTIRGAAFREKSTQGLAKKIASADGRTTVLPNDVAQANLVFDHHINRQFASTSSNLQHERLWDVGEGRILDPNKVLSHYSDQFWRTLHEKRIFGQRSSEHAMPDSVLAMMGGIEQQYPGNNGIKNRVQALVQDTFGIIPSDPTFNNAIVKGLQGVQTFKLSLSAFKNASQTGNTWMRTNGPTVLKALDAYARDSEVHFGIPVSEFRGMMASVVDNAMYEATLFQGQGRLGAISEGILNYTGFTPVEKFNRTIAGVSGAFYAQQQAKLLVSTGKQRYAKQLLELGLNPERIVANSGELLLEEKLLAGQKIINATQFRARQSDLPFFATQNPSMWRALLTFRTFSLNQVRLMQDMAHKRPGRTALFGLGVMPSIGMGVNFARDTFTENVIGIPPSASKANQDGMASYLEAAGAAGSFGFISDALYAGYMTGENSSFKDFLVPAMLSSADDYLMAAGQLARGRFPQFAHTVGRQFGGLGSAFAKSIFPVGD